MSSAPSSLASPRTGLGQSAQNAVDVFLKALKAHVRQLNVLLELHALELAVLERLYYKGKNQHGASLHWKRACEARRYGKRLQDADVGSAVQNLRASFYGCEAASYVKSLGEAHSWAERSCA
jgi:hypothetical protein